MGIGKYLLTPENLSLVRGTAWKQGRPQVIEQGLRYYDAHPKEVAQIVSNLAFMGLPSSGEDLDATLKGIAIHYYEKLFALTKTYEAHWLALNRIDPGDGLQVFREARETGRAVFMGQCHFGATYFLGVALMAQGFDVNMVGKFPEPVGGMLEKSANTISERYGMGQLRLLNLADQTIDVPWEMMRLVTAGQIVSNVFDENNRFCKPVQLLGRTLMGGTGMDLILKPFNDDQVLVVTPFLVRTSDGEFRLELDRHSLADGDIIASFYRSLGKRIREHHDQWYFIHELHECFVEGSLDPEPAAAQL